MRIVRTATVLAMIASLLGACGEATGSSETGGGPTTTSPSGSADPTPTDEWTGETIPDGTYTKTATMAHAKRLGLPRDRATEMLGRDGELHVELRIVGDDFSQSSDDGDAPLTQGDGGTTTYDGDGNLVATSTSTGCSGCVATVAWSLEGDRLTLKILDTTEAGDPTELLISRLVYEGKWTLQ